MSPEGEFEESPKEIRLEGVVLGIALGVLAALLAGAFQLGRMVERWTAPAHASSTSDPLGNVEPEAADTEKPTFFDTTTGSGKEAEPAREARAPSHPAPVPAPPPPAASGAWFVQVFVGRDRQAAEDVVRSLRGKKYPVRIDAVAEGSSGSLFKVRVGGFPTKEAAETGSDRLRGDGYSGTWVVKVGG
jgi:cell division septation protein DedD